MSAIKRISAELRVGIEQTLQRILLASRCMNIDILSRKDNKTLDFQVFLPVLAP
jgi:hypothetical protein